MRYLVLLCLTAGCAAGQPGVPKPQANPSLGSAWVQVYQAELVAWRTRQCQSGAYSPGWCEVGPDGRPRARDVK